MYKKAKTKTQRKQVRRQKKNNDKHPHTTDMSDLESKESAEQRRKQKGEGLEILTPNQMLSNHQFL